ncbi:zinc ribbon domain-containing protein, partial [Pseudoflavonifractor phocaeensis]|uniref:zinc ribbon domain-containing protein n=1 Tax=Pseudoflavonifractor phocaeensis TaxID=1870988 RepID=UPI001FAFA53D
SMLEKPEYMGHTVNFRSSKKSYRDKRVKNDPSDWLIFENTHEAIVDPETWQLAQQVKRTVRRTDTTGVANPLTGLVFCADCGAKMYNHRGKRKKDGREYGTDFYNCSTYTLTFERETQMCFSHTVSTKALNALILETIRCHGQVGGKTVRAAVCRI